MIEDRSTDIAAAAARLVRIGEYLHLDSKRAEAEALEATANLPGFWDDPSSAQATMSKAAELRDEIESVACIQASLDDAGAGNELALAEDDQELGDEVAAQIADITKRIDDLELSSWFTGEFDHGDALMTITPGQGGLEAQDWAEMLLRVYTKYAEARKWKIDLHDAPRGEELGIDRAVFTVHGKNAYGMLSSENGVHRLVRISPTDEKKRRQTTFAGVEVLPLLPDYIDVEIKDEDIRVDVYRSSGPGGQSVNTTDSAVRITHLPTGIVVTCQNEKSQLKNKETAMKILRSRVYELKKAERDAEIEAMKGEKRDITFGSQIRNYVLYPYQMVKDLRTGEETSDVSGVLSGDIDRFVFAYHRWRVGEEIGAAAAGGAGA
jgi:peptide chain release factor 2